MPGEGLYSIETVYQIYKKHGGRVSAVLKDSLSPIKARATLYRVIREHKLDERLEKELQEINNVAHSLTIEKMTALKEKLILKVMAIVQQAGIKDIRNVYAMKAAWEILRTEMNLPTTISQNANLNLDVHAFQNRTIEEIDKDIADLLISAEEASPKPPIGTKD